MMTLYAESVAAPAMDIKKANARMYAHRPSLNLTIE